MKKSNRVLFHIIKIILALILFYTALYYENASGNRVYTLITIFILYISMGLLRKILSNKPVLYNYSFIIDIILIFILEYNSRFLINYFSHSFYIITLLEISLFSNKDRGLILGILTVVVSMIKYFLLINYKNNLANVSEMAFFLLVNILILVIAYFAQHNREEKEKNELLYKELLSAHKKLRKYADQVEDLSKIEERTRIAREIHDTLGHNMTALIMEMEMAGHVIENDVYKARELINSAKTKAREGLVSVRRVVEALRENDNKYKGINNIDDLINDFTKRTGLKINFKVNGKSYIVNPTVDATIYRIIQESLTNSVRHGRALSSQISLEYTHEGIKINITDDGIGSNTIKEGFGLKGMKERVNNLKGSIEIESNDGFTIQVFLPVEVK